MLKVSIASRMKQFLCDHHYYPIAIAELEDRSSKVLYGCEKCDYILISKREGA
ncbi:hypothetical protein [Bacillus pumilus]|uniref:hypothetical protein n=1 Tax=Bacillus pumilus TaxID=1408 RepID=UPI002E1E3916|nr:hypothetical protein [Bacillus pumilus]